MEIDGRCKARWVFTLRLTLSTASSSASCSQIRMTRHPSASSALAFRLSLKTLPRSFGAQYHSFEAGTRP